MWPRQITHSPCRFKNNYSTSNADGTLLPAMPSCEKPLNYICFDFLVSHKYKHTPVVFEVNKTECSMRIKPQNNSRETLI